MKKYLNVSRMVKLDSVVNVSFMRSDACCDCGDKRKKELRKSYIFETVPYYAQKSEEGNKRISLCNDVSTFFFNL